jgi:hypothetical protein
MAKSKKMKRKIKRKQEVFRSHFGFEKNWTKNVYNVRPVLFNLANDPNIDSDSDGVKNKYDCEPFISSKQDKNPTPGGQPRVNVTVPSGRTIQQPSQAQSKMQRNETRVPPGQEKPRGNVTIPPGHSKPIPEKPPETTHPHPTPVVIPPTPRTPQTPGNQGTKQQPVKKQSPPPSRPSGYHRPTMTTLQLKPRPQTTPTEYGVVTTGPRKGQIVGLSPGQQYGSGPIKGIVKNRQGEVIRVIYK